MPVGRIILKSISDSKKLSSLKTDGARLLYTWLLTHLDINGCYSGDPQVINGKVFTRLNKSNKTVEQYLKDLEDNHLIIRYPVNGDIFLNVPDFVEKQPSLNSKREGKPSIPVPNPELIKSKSVITPTQVKISKVKISKDNVEYELSEYLFKKIKENNPDYKEPNLENWAKHVDLMIRIDKRTPEKIREVIDWCQKDDFWYKNILSTQKLREKFDRLVLNMGKAGPGTEFPKEVIARAKLCYSRNPGCYAGGGKTDDPETCKYCAIYLSKRRKYCSQTATRRLKKRN